MKSADGSGWWNKSAFKWISGQDWACDKIRGGFKQKMLWRMYSAPFLHVFRQSEESLGDLSTEVGTENAVAVNYRPPDAFSCMRLPSSSQTSLRYNLFSLLKSTFNCAVWAVVLNNSLPAHQATPGTSDVTATGWASGFVFTHSETVADRARVWSVHHCSSHKNKARQFNSGH